MTAPIEAVLDALRSHGKKTRKQSGYWMAQCPAHADNHPSLSINEGDNGGAVVNCHAGCKTGEVVAALDLTMADLFVSKSGTLDMRSRSIVTTYRYADETGGLLFEKIRKPGKQFTQRRPDGRGGWTYKLGDVRRVPYRLPEVCAAVAAGKSVLIVEGEKDADAAVRAGAPAATTNPEGAAKPGQASKWQPEYADHFRGAYVVIVPDRDGPGYAHALAVYESVAPVAAEVTIAHAIEGKDLCDHLDAGHTIEELETLTLDELRDLAAGPVEPPDSTDEPRAVEVRSIPDPLTLTPPRFLVDGLIVEATHGELAGDKKTLKSYAASTVAIGGALGLDVFGHFPVPRPFRSLIFTGEGGEALFLRRLERITHSYGATIGDVRPMVRYSTHTAPASSSALRDAIVRELDETQPALVVLDPWYAFAALEADARNLYETGRVLNDLRELVCQDDTSLLIVNHFNQTGQGNGLERITMAGHAEWCDSWWLLNHRKPPNVDAGRFALTMQIGSRQWGGNSWNIDYNIGHFDTETGTHDGPITWDVTGATGTASREVHDLAVILELIPTAIAACKSAGRGLSRRELLPLMGKGADERKRSAVDLAIRLGCIRTEDGAHRRIDNLYARDFRHADADTLREWAGITGSGDHE